MHANELQLIMIAANNTNTEKNIRQVDLETREREGVDVMMDILLAVCLCTIMPSSSAFLPKFVVGVKPMIVPILTFFCVQKLLELTIIQR